MKKILTVVAALCIGAAAWSADYQTVTKTFDLKDFAALEISGIYQVTLTADETYGVSVETPDYLEEYLDVKVTGGVLCLHLNNLPAVINKKLSREKNLTLRATVRMPRLEAMTLSGTAKLSAEGSFTGCPSFRMTLTGTSNVENLNVEAQKARLSLSGAAKCGISGSFIETDVKVSGAAKADLRIGADELTAQLSGAAKMVLEGNLVEAKLQNSGTSTLDLTAEEALRSLVYEGSGTSKLDARHAPARAVEVTLTGTAKCHVAAEESLQIEASGLSSCYYRPAAGAQVNVLRSGKNTTIKTF